jgi:hypothetical protein
MSFHSIRKESQQSGYDSNSNEDPQLRNEYQQQQEHRQMESLQEILFQWIQETNEGKIFAEKNSGWDMTIPGMLLSSYVSLSRLYCSCYLEDVFYFHDLIL